MIFEVVATGTGKDGFPGVVVEAIVGEIARDLWANWRKDYSLAVVVVVVDDVVAAVVVVAVVFVAVVTANMEMGHLRDTASRRIAPDLHSCLYLVVVDAVVAVDHTHLDQDHHLQVRCWRWGVGEDNREGSM